MGTSDGASHAEEQSPFGLCSEKDDVFFHKINFVKIS